MRIVRYEKPTLINRFKKEKDALFKRYYEGASYSKDHRRWNSISRVSPQVEERFSGRVLSQRARSLIKDSPYAHRALHCIVNNTVGAGIIPQFRTEDESVLNQIKKEWAIWAETSAIDLEGRKNFYAIQAQVLRSVVTDGECFIRIVKAKNGSKIPYQLQVLEQDYLDKFKEGRTESGYILGGIQFKRVEGFKYERDAYWMFTEHPGNYFNYQAYSKNLAFSESIPASEIIHVFRPDRPGAISGVSWFHPCISALTDLHDYQQAVLRQAKLANCFTVFVRKPDSLGDAFHAQAEELSHLEPGLIYHLGMGEDISFAAPPPPAATYSEYCNHVLKGIAAGLGITFECLGDLSTVNFSSGRMGWIEMSRNIESWRFQMLVPELCDPIWKLFSKTLSIYGIDTSSVAVGWTPPKREMINPAEETEALQMAVRSGFMTYSEALRSMGEDPDSHMRELSQDFKKLKELNLKLECDPSHDKGAIVKSRGKEE